MKRGFTIAFSFNETEIVRFTLAPVIIPSLGSVRTLRHLGNFDLVDTSHHLTLLTRQMDQS